MRRPSRWFAILLAPAAIFTSVALAAPAMAGTAPGVPTQQQLGQHRHDHFAPQSFQLVQVTNSKGQETINVVNAQGPISGSGGTDTQVSNTQDTFVLPNGDVNVFHSDVSNVQPGKVNRFCVATASAKGNWVVLGGTRKYRNAFGFGHFLFTLYIQLKRDRWGNCDTNPNHPPKLVVVKVFANGISTLGQHHRR